MRADWVESGPWAQPASRLAESMMLMPDLQIRTLMPHR